ncbi:MULTISPECIES: ABC transporter permease [Pseudomonas]|uniref:ABC transporter permease n=1 Tax=Pseudomonas TaxID=286 RepID=UPI000676516A|nr:MULTISPECIES: ABC transporter permease [Pseudomonas]WEZ87156.1 ABC transporter permease [Pseudomonas sp. NyZ480]
MNRHLKPIIVNTQKIAHIARILTLEQLREPTALLWSAIAPCLLFLLTRGHTDATPGRDDAYIHSASWFFSYISANVAFFGFSFYLVGRRESGFTRSFIYQRGAIGRFLVSHFVSYSVVSVLYALLFYLVTKWLYGQYLIIELLYVIACFYTSFMIFSCIGLAVAALPIKFNTASTLFSLLSFLMLLSGYLGATQMRLSPQSVVSFNPLHLNRMIFTNEIPLLASFCMALAALLTGLYITGRHFRIQPVWSRY